MNTAPIFLLSDFGHRDTYAGQMKAAVVKFAGCPVQIIDLCHDVPRGDVAEAAFHARAALPFLPLGSVLLAVVDPGVGSGRLGLLALWRGRYVVAPDNGLISLLDGQLSCWKLPGAPPGSSSTFHGRDIFAPCAARIACDPHWVDHLEPLISPQKLKAAQFSITDGALTAKVLHVDHFGNCVLNVPVPLRERAGEFTSLITASGNRRVARADHYSESSGSGEILLLAGSQGFMELAVNGGSASEVLNLRAGDEITLVREGSSEQ